MFTKSLLISLPACVALTAATGAQTHRDSVPSRWVTFSLTSKLVPGPVEVGALLPPGYDRNETPLPLLLFLHGGGGSSQGLLASKTTFEQAWQTGSLPPMVVLTPSAKRSFYMDYRDGSQRWERFLLEELLPSARGRFRVQQDRQGTLLVGASMGGMGALRLAFKYPERFRAVVAWAPGVEPVFAFADIDSSDRAHRSTQLYEEIFGSPVDQAYWQANHPPYLLKTRMPEIARSGLAIYLGVGREDQFNLYRGAELMHRLLDDAGVKHEFHVVRYANHNGTRFMPEGFRFLADVLRPVQP
jgi:S-formylglutathione hydrolase